MPFSSADLRAKAQIMREAFRAELGREAHPFELQVALGISWLESGFGTGWKPKGCKGSHNWGAVQSLTKTDCWHLDHHQDGRPYHAYFATYPNDLEGAKGVVRELKRRPTVLAAARAGNLGRVSYEMLRTHYYGGICRAPNRAGTPECTAQVVRDHALGLQRLISLLVAAMGVSRIPDGDIPNDASGLAAFGESGGGNISNVGNGPLVFLGFGVAAVGIFALALRKR